ncbi:hypothetical protein P3S67_015829 [Capsicum chacoense]
MLHDKAPGIDGYPAEFFNLNWSIIKQDVPLAVKKFFESGRLLKLFSCTAVSLIPKVANPTYVRDNRPIACCTTIYKIITRILTNRLKSVVKHLVNPSQSAFVEGRSIVDNILFSHEIFKWYNRKGFSPRCVMKIDLRKAYDSIEWGFLKTLLAELGFSSKFITWIMKCVTSVSYSMVINGSLAKPFQRRRGIRLGDPMSPYLFVIAMEYLHRELQLVQQHKDFKHHPRCKRLGVVHISYANDLLMFCKEELKSVRLLQERSIC